MPSIEYLASPCINNLSPSVLFLPGSIPENNLTRPYRRSAKNNKQTSPNHAFTQGTCYRSYRIVQNTRCRLFHPRMLHSMVKSVKITSPKLNSRNTSIMPYRANHAIHLILQECYTRIAFSTTFDISATP